MLDIRRLGGRRESELARGQDESRIPGQASDKRRQTCRIERFAEHGEMPVRACVLGEHAGQLYAVFRGFAGKAGNEGGDRGRHAAHVDAENDGYAQNACAVDRGSGEVLRAPAVEEAHDALDDADAGVLRGAGENPPHACPAHEPRVEVQRGAAGRGREKARVNVVRPALEGLHGEAPVPEGAAEGHGRRGLAFPRAGGGHAERGKGGHEAISPCHRRTCRRIRGLRRTRRP